MEYNIENEEDILILRGKKGNYCSNFKKWKLKIKEWFKITILDEQEPLVQSKDRTKEVQVWSRGNIYVEIKFVYIYLKIAQFESFLEIHWLIDWLIDWLPKPGK